MIRKEQPFEEIPYYAWAHRGAGEMIVWLPEPAAAAQPPRPTIAAPSKVIASVPRNARGIQDGEAPQSSRYRNPYGDFDWTPKKGTTEWVQYAFAKPLKVSQASVYWIDNTGTPNADCSTPKSWRLLYRNGADWKPVQNLQPYSTEKDKFNNVTFAPVVTDSLRLEVVLRADASAGVRQWVVQ